MLLVALGCTAGRPSTPAPSVRASYVRTIIPFHVRTSDGALYPIPFLGGLNVPRPQLVDIDADGDVDLFIQEMSGRVMFFEHERGEGYVWRTDAFHQLDVGEWYRFADLDRDGDYDLLAEHPFSYIRYYRNVGSPAVPHFRLVADTLRDVSGEPIFSDRQNIPNVTDIDCDGDLDLFIGRLVGTVTFYESLGLGPDSLPRFRFVTDRFQEIEIISQIGSRHGANTMTFADIDADGDQDFFWGDFFDPVLLYIENTGSCQRPDLTSAPVAFPVGNAVETSGYNAPTFGDVDRDGDLDLLMGVLGGAFNANRTTVDNLILLEQHDRETFVERTRQFLVNVDVGSESIPTVADLDDDGDLDLLLANKLDPQDLETARIYHFENIGTRDRPAFRMTGPLEIRGQYHLAPALADLDADGDLDMVLGSWRADVAYYRNAGSARAPRFVLADSSIVRLTRGSNSTPALVDIDDDGDLDLFVGEASGTVNFYRNTGSPQSPTFTLVTDELGGIDVGRRSAPSFVDLDGDGDWDLVIGSESGRLIVYANQGTTHEPRFATADTLAPRAPGLAAPAFRDLDGNGLVDLLVGTIGGGVLYFEGRNTDTR